MAVQAGTELRRTGTSTSWSKVVYEGKEYYAGSKYLTTTAPSEEAAPEFTEVNETVYVVAESQLNLRETPNLSTGVIKQVVARGTVLTRTGIATSADGTTSVSRVIYKLTDGTEVTLYASSKYLSTEAPKTETAG
jgi:uncharacterized protein YgiM (DUF1202 family)